MKIAYQSNTGRTLVVNHSEKNYLWNNCGFLTATIINVGTNKELDRLEKALIKGGYNEIEKGC